MPVPSRYDCPVSTLDIADSYRIRQARAEEAEAVHTLMVEVAAGMDRPELFACDDLPFIRAHLFDPAQGFGLVAVDEDDAIVGALVVRYPGADADNLGRDADLAGADLARVAHMESAVVHPSARGHHLQRAMIDQAERLIDAHAHPYLFATVAPDNAPSLATLEAAGYCRAARKQKYGGLDRLIMRKDLGEAEIRYRPMALPDFDGVVALNETEWFLDPGTSEATEAGHLSAQLDILIFLQSASFAAVAECGGEIVGVVLADVWADSPLFAEAGVLKDRVEAELDASEEGRAALRELVDFHAGYAELADEVRERCQAEWQLFLVSKAMRGRGVGGELWRRLRAHLRARGVTAYFLYTDTGCDWRIYEDKGMERAVERRGEESIDGSTADRYIYVGQPTP